MRSKSEDVRFSKITKRESSWLYKNKSPKVDALRLFNKVTLKEALDFNCTQIYHTSFSLPRILTIKI